MNIYVYSDESGVFDKVHNKVFIFAGIIILEKTNHEEWARRYSNAERTLRTKKKVNKQYELKASNLNNKEKSKLFRSLNNCYKFAVVIDQEKVLDRIFKSKKDKQRYLDYAYKIAVKRAFQKMVEQHIIIPEEVEHIFFRVDEHTTATNGCYELREGLEQELKSGTYNYNYNVFHAPVFSNVKSVNVEFCNSSSKLLIRAADIVANKVYHLAFKGEFSKIQELPNTIVTYLPYEKRN